MTPSTTTTVSWRKRFSVVKGFLQQGGMKPELPRAFCSVRIHRCSQAEIALDPLPISEQVCVAFLWEVQDRMETIQDTVRHSRRLKHGAVAIVCCMAGDGGRVVKLRAGA